MINSGNQLLSLIFPKNKINIIFYLFQESLLSSLMKEDHVTVE